MSSSSQRDGTRREHGPRCGRGLMILVLYREEPDDDEVGSPSWASERKEEGWKERMTVWRPKARAGDRVHLSSAVSHSRKVFHPDLSGCQGRRRPSRIRRSFLASEA